MVALWAEVQRLHTRVAEWEATLREPVKDARNARVPPSHTRQPNPSTRPAKGTRREARVGRVGGGRPRHPDPDHVIIAKAKVCPHGGQGVPEEGPSLQAVYDTSEVPPLKPIVPRVEPEGGRCTSGGQPSVAPVPAGLEPGTPCGASVQSLATYRRSTPAISDERRSALLAQVLGLDSREGGLAHLFQGVKGRLDQRVAEILTRWRGGRLMWSDATRARVNGRQPGEWVVQNAAGCLHGIRPRRGPGVIQEVRGAPRPTIGVSDLYRAHKHHPAEAWQGCLAHQLRDGQVALEAGDPVFAPRMQRVWRRALAIHTRRDPLAASPLYQYRCDLRRRVDRC